MEPVQLSRRTFLTHLGRGAVAVAVFGPVAAACGDSGSTATTGAAATSAATSAPPTTSAATTTTTQPPATTQPETTTTTAPTAAGGTWGRVNLGFVSAYVLVRDGRAAVVDTGVPGSAPQIEGVLGGLGAGWDAVDHVILTHLHGDHIGDLGPVMEAAAGAAAYAGAGDIGGMGASPRPVNAVGDGDSVFGLDIIDTPGHTEGHIAVHDMAASVLLAGDAMNGVDGGVGGANPDFTPDMAAAGESIKKLAALRFDTVFFGHGEPVIGGADALVADLAATL